MQILLIMLIVVLLAFSVLLLALAKQSPREKQTEDKEQEEYIRDYAETVRQTGGSMKKLEHWKVIAIYLIIYDMIAVNFSYFMALLVRFDFRYSSIPTDYFDAWRSFAPIYTIIILAVFGCLHLYNSVWRFASFHVAFKPLGIEVLDHYNEEHQSSGHLYITRIPGITLEQRHEIIVKMAEKGVACNVHYKPLPMMTAYKNMGFDIKDYPNAYKRFENEITLPLHTKLTDEEVEYVIEMFLGIVKEYIKK